jgi:hypothetical protein
LTRTSCLPPSAFITDTLFGVRRLRDMLGLDAQMLEDVDMDDEDVPAVRRGGKLGNWAKIGWLAVGRSHRAPGVEFM